MFTHKISAVLRHYGAVEPVFPSVIEICEGKKHEDSHNHNDERHHLVAHIHQLHVLFVNEPLVSVDLMAYPVFLKYAFTRQAHSTVLIFLIAHTVLHCLGIVADIAVTVHQLLGQLRRMYLHIRHHSIAEGIFQHLYGIGRLTVTAQQTSIVQKCRRHR